MPPKPSRKVDRSTHPSHLRAGSGASTPGAISKVASDEMPMSADRGHPDFSSTSYGDASPLHFHGLAVTQTQTQVASCAEQSGKGSTVSETRVIKKRKVGHDADIPSLSESPLKALNVVSETKSATRSASKLKRRRSPSVDSFAEAEEWEDPAKGFLAANRKFEIPLSELGRGETQVDYRGYETPTAPGSPPAALPHEPTQIDLPSSSGRPPDPGSRHKQRTRQSGAQGDDILSQVSDVSLGAPGPDDTRENETQEVPYSTPPLVSNPGSLDHMDTQVEDYQSTQPLASEDLDAATTQVSDVGVPHVGQSSPQEYTSMDSRPSTNTRNILGMVNPMKKWRHQQGQLLQQHNATDCILDGQTQPSVDVSRSSHALSTGRRLFEQLAAQMRAEPQPSREHDHNDLGLPAIDEDSRETAVVPDSEPAGSSSPIRPKLSIPPDDSLHESPQPQPVIRDNTSQPSEGTDPQTDDDEDVPLMLAAGRQAPRVAPLSENASDLPKAKSPRTSGRSERAPKKVKVTRTRGTDVSVKEIPSSVPDRDHRPPLPSRSLTPPRSSSRRKGKRRDYAVEDMPTPDPAPDPVTSTSTPGKGTESADDLPVEAEDDAPTPRDPKMSLNRRRLPTSSVRKARYRSAPREVSKTPSLAPAARATKRNKSHSMITRVFALWKQDAAYFSGTVGERVGSLDRFKIQFDDGDEDVVDVKNLRRLELRVGDRVSIIESQEKATVANVDGQNQGTVVVQMTNDPEIEFKVEVAGIKIHSRAISAQWEDRTISLDEIVTLVPTSKTETPSSLRNSTTILNKKVLAKVGIVVTLSVTAGCDREKEKESILRLIRNIGGTVLEDWSDIFSLAGEFSSNKKRWVITSDSIGTETKLDIQQVFLVSDAANAKPRYLTALALGIPCLSVAWLGAVSSGQCTVAEWPSYLLSAGYSDTLGARVTQMVDLDWGTTLDHLTGIMSNKVPTKLFSNMSVLVLGQEYFPPPAKGKKKTPGLGDEKSGDGPSFVPRIIVSMGAARVEAVPELKYSTDPDLEDFQYVVVKELHERPPVGGEKYVSMEWVKDCLIAGRMFPPRG